MYLMSEESTAADRYERCKQSWAILHAACSEGIWYSEFSPAEREKIWNDAKWYESLS